jgi:hypothetical protein
MLLLITVSLLLWSCARAPEPAPVPQRPPLSTPAVGTPVPPKSAPATQEQGKDWRDWPLTPGDWAYRRDGRGSIALFGPAGQDAHFVIRCDIRRNRIFLSRAGNFAGGDSGRMTLRTTTALQTYPLANSSEDPPFAAAELDVGDRHLDAMAFSRGRFIVAVKGAPDLVIPTWPEFARVVEDCRRATDGS